VVSLETIHDIVDVCEVLYLFFGFTDETAYACFSKDLMLGYDNHIERSVPNESLHTSKLAVSSGGTELVFYSTIMILGDCLVLV